MDCQWPFDFVEIRPSNTYFLASLLGSYRYLLWSYLRTHDCTRILGTMKRFLRSATYPFILFIAWVYLVSVFMILTQAWLINSVFDLTPGEKFQVIMLPVFLVWLTWETAQVIKDIAAKVK